GRLPPRVPNRDWAHPSNPPPPRRHRPSRGGGPEIRRLPLQPGGEEELGPHPPIPPRPPSRAAASDDREEDGLRCPPPRRTGGGPAESRDLLDQVQARLSTCPAVASSGCILDPGECGPPPQISDGVFFSEDTCRPLHAEGRAHD